MDLKDIYKVILGYRIGNRALKKWIPFIFKRMAFVYLVLFLFLGIVIDHSKLKLKTLHHLRPSQASLEQIIYDPQYIKKIDKKELVKFLEYFKKLGRYTKYKFEAYSLMGYCYYYLGARSKSISYYKKSLSLNSKFFWSNYNLGLIYFESKDYKKALKYFERAVSVDIRSNIVFLNKSMVYFTFVNDAEKYVEKIKEGLKNGYANCFRLIALSFYNLGDFNDMVRISQEALLLEFEDRDSFSFYIGLAYFKIGKYKEALSFFSKILNKNNKDVDAFYYASLCFKEMGEESLSLNFLMLSNKLKATRGHTSSLNPDVSLKIF